MVTEESPDPDTTALAEELHAAADEVATAQRRVEEVGEHRLEALEGATNQLARILDQYEDSATGSGDFEAYMECRMAVQELVEGLDDDLPNRDIFEAVADRFDSRRLSDRDFTWAETRLDEAREPLHRLHARSEAKEQLQTVRRQVRDRLSTIEDRIDHLETVADLGEANLDAPIDAVRNPIESYNDAVRTTFESFLADSSARDVFSFISSTTAYPLVTVKQPPQDLAAYIEEYEAGTEPIPTLLEYAEYSRSKLDHYVEEPMELKRHVATHRTYLTRLDATPFTIDWPPPTAETLQYRIRELISVVDRFAETEPITHLRTVRAATRRDDYEEIRAAARAKAELDEEDRAQLRAGEVQSELATRRTQRETLEDALAAID